MGLQNPKSWCCEATVLLMVYQGEVKSVENQEALIWLHLINCKGKDLNWVDAQIENR